MLYAPGLYDLATIKTVVSALKKPFNLVMGFADPTLTVTQLSAAGVKRISVGGAMARVALAAFLKCAREMKDQGAFTYVREMAPMKDVRAAFAAVQARHSGRGVARIRKVEIVAASPSRHSGLDASHRLGMTVRATHPSLNPYSGTLPLAP